MIDRPPLLAVEPRGRVEDLKALVGLANAIEVEAVARYAQLAALMEARGDSETAAIFHDMCEMERGHIDMVARLAVTLQQSVPAPAGFSWLLPPEIAESWDAVQNSALLTPYRALAIAVMNEERAFALYSYLAARADDARIARQAEALAREELTHAAQLRVRRRQSFRRMFVGSGCVTDEATGSPDAFRALHRRLMQTAAGAHRAIAAALAATGDAESAALVTTLAQREEVAAAAKPTPTAVRTGRPPLGLLQEALRPLETASEAYEDIIVQATQESLLLEAQAAHERVIEGISLLSQRLRQLDARSGTPLP